MVLVVPPAQAEDMCVPGRVTFEWQCVVCPENRIHAVLQIPEAPPIREGQLIHAGTMVITVMRASQMTDGGLDRGLRRA